MTERADHRRPGSSDQNYSGVRFKHTLVRKPGPAAGDIEQQVILFTASSEVLPGVINHMVSSKRTGVLDVPRAAHGGHVNSERFRNLDGERAYASGCAVDQDFLPGLDLSIVAQTLQCSESR